MTEIEKKLTGPDKARVALIVEGGLNMKALVHCIDALCDFGVRYEIYAVSGHATPTKAIELASGARKNGFEVIIAAAPGVGLLPGLLAAHTTLPVIAVPIGEPSLHGLDALLATARAQRGVPVANVAIDGALNAALLAITILAVHDASLAEALEGYRQLLQTNLSHMDQRVRSQYAFKPKKSGEDTTA